jgi:(2Fe-2S) ferredoxin
MSYYQYHIFCCGNERPEGHERGCCKSKGADALRNYLKARVKELGLERVRVNQAGCLDRCELGPAVVVYPEGVWYRPTCIEDMEKILQSHVIGGVPAEELRVG